MRRRMCWHVLGLAGALLAGACDSSNDPEEHPLVGTWDLTSMTRNGAPEDPIEWNDVAVQVTFLADGTGWSNIEDYGQPQNANPIGLTWSASRGTLRVRLVGEDTASLGFTVSGNTLTIFDTEGQGSWISVYTRALVIAPPVDPGVPIIPPE